MGAEWERSGRDGEEMMFLWLTFWHSFDLGTPVDGLHIHKEN